MHDEASQGLGCEGVLFSYVEHHRARGNEVRRERRPARYQRVPTLSIFELTDQFGAAVPPLE